MVKRDLMIEDLHEIRLKIYEETKHMTPEERIAHTKKIAAEGLKQMEELKKKKVV